MRGRKHDSLLGKKPRLFLEDGRSLRILSAMDVVTARREGAALAQTEGEFALCSNACILAKALEKEGKPLFLSGRALLEAYSVSEVQELAKIWASFDRKENPKMSIGDGEIEVLKKAWSTRLVSAYAGVCSAVLGCFPLTLWRKK